MARERELLCRRRGMKVDKETGCVPAEKMAELIEG